MKGTHAAHNEFVLEEIFSPGALHALMNHQAKDGVYISILTPSQDQSGRFDADRIQLKNLIKLTEQKLTNRNVSVSSLRNILQPIYRFLETTTRWPSRYASLAIFLSEQFAVGYAVPVRLSPTVTVGERFYLKPLFSLLNRESSLYVLILSQKQVRLFKKDANGLIPLEMKEIPEGIKDILNLYDPERNIQFRTEPSGQSGKRPALYHGHGAAADESQSKSRLIEYLRKVDSSVQTRLKGEKKLPLIICAVDSIQSLFKEVSSYDHIHPAGPAGNLDNVSKQELHSLIAPLANQISQEAVEEQYKEYLRLKGSDLCSRSIRKCIVAAREGAIDTFFVSLSSEIWGTIPNSVPMIRIDRESTDENWDLLDIVAQETYRNGGKVFIESTDAPFMNERLAAIFRYPLRDFTSDLVESNNPSARSDSELSVDS